MDVRSIRLALQFSGYTRGTPHVGNAQTLQNVIRAQMTGLLMLCRTPSPPQDLLCDFENVIRSSIFETKHKHNKKTSLLV